MQQRHEPLRAAVGYEDGGKPFQEIHRDAPMPFERADWRQLAADERDSRLARYLAEDRRRGFALSEAPLTRLMLAHEAPEHHRFVWSFHHLLLDGRSFPIILREVFDVYERLRDGRDAEIVVPRPYRAYVDWITGCSWGSAERFWGDLLDGWEGPTRILDACHHRRYDSPSRDEAMIRLSAAATDALYGAARAAGVSTSTMIYGAWALLLSHYTDDEEVLFGAAHACRSFPLPDAEGMVGLFINSLPLRVAVAGDEPLDHWLRSIRRQQLAVRDFEHTPLATIQSAAPESGRGAGRRLFDSLVIFDHQSLDSALGTEGPWQRRSFELHEQTDFALTLYVHAESRLELKLAYDRPPISDATAEQMLGHLRTLLEGMASEPDRLISAIPTLPPAERDRQLLEWNNTEGTWPQDRCVHELIEAQAIDTPDSCALIFRDQPLTYRELERRATRLAEKLRRIGLGPETRAAVLLERSPEMVVAVLAVLKAGAAYVPVDPGLPQQRIDFILQDSGVRAVITDSASERRIPTPELVRLLVDDESVGVGTERMAIEPRVAHLLAGPQKGVRPQPDNLAYVMYTSGSTGTPKGVMVEHRNVASFFAAMDDVIDADEAGVWLAVTSLSFDISVLELLWTLSRGFAVVLAEDPETLGKSPAPTTQGADDDGLPADPAPSRTVSNGSSLAAPERLQRRRRAPQLSLYYFSSDESSAGDDKYELLRQGVRFADRHGFHAVWTPERHFHRFGGLFPNPAVTSAAIAALTENIQIRAGSVVGPLHSPIRVAEEWAVVDNLSGGRVGVSLASGWQPNDFVLMPDNYEHRKQILRKFASDLRALWRGDQVRFPGPLGDEVAVRTLPRPIQSELPVWITAAGSPGTFREAGELGANVLTHLLGQTIDELTCKLEIYRQAWLQASKATSREAASGGGAPWTTLMVHTFLGNDLDDVRRIVREPMKQYLRSAMSLVRDAAWSFPAFKHRVEGNGSDIDAVLDSLPVDELDALLEHSFRRYFDSSGLLGTPDRARASIAEFEAIGIDEVACLIDFGVGTADVMQSLELLAELNSSLRRRDASPLLVGDRPNGGPDDGSIAGLINRHRVTHLQCTPSMARLLIADSATREALPSVRHLLVGGEALTSELAAELRTVVGGDTRITNMYGPTETTIWSSTCVLSGDEPTVPIGRPIRNTRLYVLGRHMEPMPAGVVGELYIGGPGVARGYLNRPRLTDQRFVPDPFGGGRLYRTGDLVAYRPDGVLEFHGRMDRQVKVRGHRIELQEIEARLDEHARIEASAVMLRELGHGEERLVAYYVSADDPVASRTGSVELRQHLELTLPPPMIPVAFVHLEAFPLTPNGKVDYQAMPSPGPRNACADSSAPSASSPPYNAPVDTAQKPPVPDKASGNLADLSTPAAIGGGPRETTADGAAPLIEAWRAVLGVDEIALDDNFFELGGDSILAIQIVGRLRQVGLRIGLRDLLVHPTIAGLLELVAAAPARAVPTVPVESGPTDSSVQLSPAQRWFLESEPAHPDQYNQAMFLELRVELDPATLSVAIDHLVQLHDMLRLRLVRDEEGSWRQRIASTDDSSAGNGVSRDNLKVIDLRATARPGLDAALEARIRELHRSLDLQRGPVFRAAYFRLPAGVPDRLLLVTHHLAVDGISWRILLEDLQTAYHQLGQGEPVRLPEPTAPFGAWTHNLTLHADALQTTTEAETWMALAEDRIDGSMLPRDMALGANDHGSTDVVVRTLDEAATRRLLTRPAHSGVELDAALLASLTNALCNWSGEPHVLVDLEGHGREELTSHLDVTRTVGWFTAIYPVLLEGSDDNDGAALQRRIAAQLQALPNRGIGYGALRYLGRGAASRRLRQAHTAEVQFNYLGQFDRFLDDSPLFGPVSGPLGPFSRVAAAEQMRPYLFEIVGIVVDGRMRFAWEYSRNLHRRSTVEGIAGAFLRTLCNFAERPLPESSDPLVRAESGAIERRRPADFPLADLTQEQLDLVLSRLSDPARNGSSFDGEAI